MKNILLIILLFFSSIGHAQNLTSQDWVNFLCNNSYIQSAKSISIDKDQNIYILGRFPNQTNCLNQDFYEEDGVFLLFKLNSNGEEIWIKSIGSSYNFSSGGDMEINNEGDIILGFPFRGDFMVDQETICSSNKTSSIILKLDSEGNLKWFKTFNATTVSYVRDLHLDENDNIYSTISFFDSLNINNENLFQKHYGSCISKLNSNGEIEWYHQIHSNNTIKIRELDFMVNEKKTLIISGELAGDSLFINNEFFKSKVGKYNNQNFILTIEDNGEIRNLKMLDSNIRTVTAVSNFNGNIYLSGTFIDTVCWLEYETKATTPYTPFIGELSNDNEITFFKDIFFSKDIYISDLIISSEYGFLMSGSFKGEFKSGLDSITLSSEYKVGSFITNFNGKLEQEEINFIKGGTIGIVDMELKNEKIIALANYEGNCSFENLEFNAWNLDFLVFQTSQLNSLNEFNIGDFSYPELVKGTISDTLNNIQIYPNPFNESITIEGITGTNLIIYNLSGINVTEGFIITRYGNKVILDSKDIPSGIYFLSIDGFENKVVKVIKINR